MYYFFKKKLKLIASVGVNPKLWVIELATRIISQKSNNNTSFENPFFSDILLQTEPDNTDTFTVDQEAIKNNPEKIESLLSEYGICIITNFIPHKIALQAGNEACSYLCKQKFQSPKDSSKGNYNEEDNYLWQTDNAWTNNYLKAANYRKPVINIRSRKLNVDDAGMIDIFNIQKLAINEDLKATDSCLKIMSAKDITSLLTNFTGYKQRQFNLYYNKGVIKTRGPHIDNNSDPHKLFVYLTDVESDSHGPYCYLPGSIKKRNWMSYERLKNVINKNPSTEVSSLSRTHLTKVFGKAGTAIITNQSGIHCGGVQTEDGERVLLISNYY